MSFSEIDFIHPSLFHTLYLTVVMLCSFLTVFYYLSSSDKNNLQSSNMVVTGTPALALSLFFCFLLGLRPAIGTTIFFGDTSLYAHAYNNIINDYVPIDWSTEWIWENLNFLCKDFGLDVNNFFLIVESVYILFMFGTCIKLMRKNIWIAMLFCLVSYSFWGYGINGIRNGMACSLTMFAIALLTGNYIEKICSILLMIVAYGIHHSTMLPSVCAIGAFFLIKEPKHAIGFWGASIILSLLIGNYVGNIFQTLGFDERTSYFADIEEHQGLGYSEKTGFRFDFLLYSAMPVLMVYYLTVKRNFKDSAYNIIANTYILANAFWIMVIRATFSNRFAYLSWFIYPIVIAYPLIRFKIWDKQNRNAALILLAYSSFTLFMFLIGK